MSDALERSAALERFLRLHADDSVSLLAALPQGDAAGTWVHRYAGTTVTGAALHAANGWLIAQAPEHGGELVREAAQKSGRPIAGLLAPWEQALQMRAALGLAEAPTRACEREIRMALPLEALRLPAQTFDAGLPREDELDAVDELLQAGAVELGQDRADPARLRRSTRAALGAGDISITRSEGQPASVSRTLARLADLAEIGGVYTLPALRNRGHARAAVAAHCLALRAAGVRRAVLMARESNLPALASYRALGFVEVSRYGLVLFAEPELPR